MEAGRRDTPPKEQDPLTRNPLRGSATTVKGPLLLASIWPRSLAKGALAQAWTLGLNVSLGQHTPKWVLFRKKAVLGGRLRLLGGARKDTGAEMLLGPQCVCGELGAQVRPPARGTCQPFMEQTREERKDSLGAASRLPGPTPPRITVLLEEVGP